MSQLMLLRDVPLPSQGDDNFGLTQRQEFVDLDSGKVYEDAEGVRFLRQMHEVDHVVTGNKTGSRAVTVKDENGRKIHNSQISDAAALHYADKRVLSTGRREKFSGRGVQMNIKQAEAYDRLFNMDLAPSDVHTNSALPTYAAGYRIADGMADVASPVILTPKQADVFYTWNQNSDFQRKLPVAGAPGAGYGEVNPALSPSTFTTVQYTLGGFMPTEVVANADTPIRPFVKLTQVVIDALRLEREYRVAAGLQTSGNWNAGNVTTLLAGAQWNGGGASDPIFNLHKAIESSYLPVTGILWSELVEHDFVRNPNVQKYFTYKDTVDGIPDPQKISSTLRLPPIYTAMMKYVTGSTLTYVWGNHVVLLHNTGDLSSQMDVATARTFRWNGAEGATPDGTLSAGFLVRTFFDPKRGARGGTQVVVVHSDTEVQTSGYAGALILNAHI
jgi:hypothetical protein